jgi:hypothetical protein
VRRHVFGPRRPYVSDPPPPNAAAQGAPGRALLFCVTEAAQAVLFAGAVSIAPPPAPRPPETLRAPEIVAVEPEPPRPEALAGRAIQPAWGIAQPEPQTPRPARAPSVEAPRPTEGWAAVARPPMDHRPTGGSASNRAAARGEDAPPAEGRVAIAKYGLAVPRVPGRVTVARPECVRPHPGAAIAASAPLPGATDQQRAIAALLIAAEPPPLFPGWCLARAKPLVPSDRLPTRALLACAEESRPFAGDVRALRVRLGHPPPGRFVLAIARQEELPPVPGAVAKAGPAVELASPQQLPGRVTVAWVESPRPDWIARGLALILNGRAAGAIAPSLVGATPGGRFVRADAWNRSIKRLPRMGSTLTYVTRTKAPDEIIAVVFDFSNFPEVVGGATISSAVVSGPGGQSLTGLTAGAPTVLAIAATVDSLGNTVAAGKGVQVAISGGGIGDDVIIACAATLSTGSIAVIQGKIAVRNAE